MYDVIIIGGGMAGLTAAVYSARYRLKTLVVSNEMGGVIVESTRVENWPGINSVAGLELMQNVEKQAKELGVEIKTEMVESVKKKDCFLVNDKHKSKKIVIAIGMKRRKLNIPGEDEFSGKGLSYCATCDAAFFKDKTVCVVGGNDSAAIASLLLSEYAKKVYIIYRKEKIRAEPYWTDQIDKNKKIEIINNTNVVELIGDKFLNKVLLSTGKEMYMDGVFVEIGSEPDDLLIQQLGLDIDKEGYIKVDARQETNNKGVYAAGDITTASNKLKQLVTAAGEGAIAASSIYKEV